MLSVIIPVYNEKDTVCTIIDRVRELPVVTELIVVDNKSTDGTREIIEALDYPDLRVILQSRNLQKGNSVKKGIRAARGEYTVIQDADLEYDPNEYNLLLKPVLDGYADVVYGSRFMGGKPHRILFFWHSIGNKFLTFLSNTFTNLNLTDMETCYKLFKTEIIKSIRLKENRFGFEPEITAKISKIKNIRIYEIGISYYGRTYQEGKKINWKDGFRAIYCIIKYGLLSK